LAALANGIRPEKSFAPRIKNPAELPVYQVEQRGRNREEAGKDGLIITARKGPSSTKWKKTRGCTEFSDTS
jgi:hypothetical protein